MGFSWDKGIRKFRDIPWDIPWDLSWDSSVNFHGIRGFTHLLSFEAAKMVI
jgi:hypothetical protein